MKAPKGRFERSRSDVESSKEGSVPDMRSDAKQRNVGKTMPQGFADGGYTSKRVQMNFADGGYASKRVQPTYADGGYVAVESKFNRKNVAK